MTFRVTSFQGRFHGFLVEDESSFWAVSRSGHLNPVPVLVTRPEQWKWSTYLGYVDPSAHLPWVDYETLRDAWQGGFGGNKAEESCRQYVEQGLASGAPSPFELAIDGWILGSQQFADRMRAWVRPADRRSHERSTSSRQNDYKLLRGCFRKPEQASITCHSSLSNSAIRRLTSRY